MLDRKKSIAPLVAMVLVIAATLILGAFALSNHLSEQKRQMARLHLEHSILADQLSESLALPVWNLDRAQIDKIVESAIQGKDVFAVAVRIADVNSTLHLRSRNEQWRVQAPRDEPEASGLLLEKRSINANGEKLGTLTVFVTPKFVRADLRKTLVRTLFSILAFDALLILCLYLLLWRLVLKPIKLLEEHAALVSSGNGEARPLQGMRFEGELDNLRQSLDKMLGLLKARYEALLLSERKFGTIFRESPIALSVTEFETGRIIEINEALLRLMRGHSFDQMIHRTSLEIGMLNPDRRQALFQEVLSSGRLDRVEVEMRRLDLEPFLAEISVSRYELDAKSYLLTNIVDITERKQAEENLRHSREELRTLAGRLQAVREEERTRIAREIHDVLEQDLTRLKIDLSWVGKKLAGDADEFAAKLNSLLVLTDSCISAVQRIASELRPVVLDSLGLPAAIEWQAGEFQERTGISCETVVTDDDFELPRESATGIFRIVQESLTNVLRHSHATHVDIILELDEGQLRLRVEDNGIGFDPKALKDPHSMGLLGMRERATLLGAHFEINSAPGKGARILVAMPARAPSHENPSR